MLKNWTLSRAVYLTGGIALIAIAVNDRVWWLGLFGIYFAAMAVFRYGCAAGKCEIPSDKNGEFPN